jgi:hypothetical protein
MEEDQKRSLSQWLFDGPASKKVWNHCFKCFLSEKKLKIKVLKETKELKTWTKNEIVRFKNKHFLY